jgi:hypothetical protein
MPHRRAVEAKGATRRAGPGSDPSALRHGGGGAIPDHEVVQHAHLDQRQRLLQPRGHAPGRRRSAPDSRWDGCGRRSAPRRCAARPGANLARMHLRAIERAAEQLFVRDHAMARIEEQAGEDFVRQGRSLREKYAPACDGIGQRSPRCSCWPRWRVPARARPPTRRHAPGPGPGSETSSAAGDRAARASRLRWRAARSQFDRAAPASPQPMKIAAARRRQRAAPAPQLLPRAFVGGQSRICMQPASRRGAPLASGDIAASVSLGSIRSGEISMGGLAGQRILLGITGGSRPTRRGSGAAPAGRRRAGARGDDRGAQQFITPLTLQALTGEPVRSTCGMPPPKRRWATSNWRAGPRACWSRRRAPTSSRGSPRPSR